MKSIRRILVAIKRPSGDVPVLARKAAQLARACGAELELFHSVDAAIALDPLMTAVAMQREYREDMAQRALAGLARTANQLRRYDVRIATSTAWDYPPADAIIRRARACAADLIVVGLHAARHRFTWLPGLTDWDVLRDSPVPVLIVKSTRPYRRPVVLAPIDPLHVFAKPAGLDAEILRMAGAFARNLKGTVQAMHAYLPNVYAMPSVYDAKSTAHVLRAARRAARTRFDKALRMSGIRVSRRHLIEAHPVDAIPNTARRIGGSLVVMGAISRSGLKRFFIGNTAERVLDRLECDVLVVKPRHFASRVQKRPALYRRSAA
jgi:universal stress protein E